MSFQKVRTHPSLPRRASVLVWQSESLPRLFPLSVRVAPALSHRHAVQLHASAAAWRLERACWQQRGAVDQTVATQSLHAPSYASCASPALVLALAGVQVRTARRTRGRGARLYL